jgi:hypothetical protein
MRRMLFVVVGSVLLVAMLALGPGGIAFGQAVNACDEDKAGGDASAVRLQQVRGPQCDFTGADDALFSEGAPHRSDEANLKLFSNYCSEFGDPACDVIFE